MYIVGDEPWAIFSCQLSVIRRPPGWGGYRLSPDYYEFWQGRDDRLHDRIIYRHTESYWRISRLAP
ncbi:MAG: pyridoxine 5'-phosphate oxidase C-terminal domain-containing protein [Bacteroidales bacterium]